MTVQSSYAKAGPYLAEGQNVFPFRFKVLEPEQVRVYLGTEALEPLTGYAVNITDTGGEVIFDTPPDRTVTLLREMDFSQRLDIQNNTAFLAEVIEEALDELTMMCQQLKVDTDRAVKLSVDSVKTPDEYTKELFDAVDRGEQAADTSVNAAAAAAAAEKSAGASAASAADNAAAVAEGTAEAKTYYEGTKEIGTHISGYFGGELAALTHKLVGDASGEIDNLIDDWGGNQ